MAQAIETTLNLRDNFTPQMQKAMDVIKQMSNASANLNKQFEEIGKRQKLTDRIKATKSTFDELSKSSVEISKALKDVGVDFAKQFNDEVSKSANLYDDKAKKISKHMTSVSDSLKSYFPEISQQINQVSEKMTNLNPNVKALIEKSVAITPVIKAYADKSGLTDKINSVINPIKEKASAMNKRLNKPTKTNEALKDFGNVAFKQLSGNGVDATKLYKDTASQISKPMASISNAIMPFFPQLSQQINQVTDKMTNLNPKFKELVGNGMALSPAIKSFSDKSGLSSKITSVINPIKEKASTISKKIKLSPNASKALNGVGVAALKQFSDPNEGTKVYNDKMGQVTKPLTSVSDTIKPFFPGISKSINQVTEKINNLNPNMKMLIGNGMAMAPALSSLVSGGLNINKVTDAYKKLKPSLDLAKIGQMLLNAVMSINPVGIIVVAIGVLIGVLIYLWNTNKSFRTAVIGIWNEVKKVFSTVINAIKGLFTGLVDRIMKIPADFANFKNEIYKHIMDLFNKIGSVLNNIKNNIVSIWSGILNFFASLPIKLYQHGVSIITGLKDGIAGTIGFVTGAITNGFNGAINFIKNLPAQCLQWGADMINGLVNGIKNTIGAIENAVKGVADKIKGFLHFSRPDVGPLADYETWMPDFMKGMGNGIKINTHLVTDKVKDVAVGIKTNMKGTQSGQIISNTADSGIKKSGITINIPKLAEQIIIRGDYDLDEIVNKLTQKLEIRLAAM